MERFFSYKRKPLFIYLVIVAGTGLLAFAIKCIFDQISMVTGGFTGLSILLKELTGFFYRRRRAFPGTVFCQENDTPDRLAGHSGAGSS